MTEALRTGQERRKGGMDVARIRETIEAIRRTPALAKCEFRARSEWVDGGACRTRIWDFYGSGEDSTRNVPLVLDVDAMPDLLCESRGAHPVEYALAALASCLTVTLVYHAAARGIELGRVESRLEGDIDLHGFLGLDEQGRPGCEEIRVVFEVEGDASEEDLAELTRLVQRRSPVFDIVTNRVPVAVRITAVR